MSKMYLPDWTDFEYRARVPWPRPPEDQVDWIWQESVLTEWLRHHVGGRYSHWAWSTDSEHRAWEACVAFRWDRDRCLFLLKWGQT